LGMPFDTTRVVQECSWLTSEYRDSIDDMTAGYRAGAATVLLVNEVNAHMATHEHTDLCISRLDELIEVLEKGFEGQIGRDEELDDTHARAAHVLKQGKGEEMA
jgi:hypothetical protein